MEVTFTRAAGRRYFMSITRARGPDLGPQQAPGFNPFLPHESAHLLVESEAGIRDGIFGQFAAGGAGLIWPSDRGEHRSYKKKLQRPASSEEKRSVALSERLASVCQPFWECRRGYRKDLPDWCSADLLNEFERDLVDRILTRFDHFSARWRDLGQGESVSVSWPDSQHSSPRHSPGVRQKA
jgi:hypothetical protein